MGLHLGNHRQRARLLNSQKPLLLMAKTCPQWKNGRILKKIVQAHEKK
jgi:hypothetical protein